MYVIKRQGHREGVRFDKITERIQNLIREHETAHLSAELLAQKTVSAIYPGITTEELDIESARICESLCTTHHLYSSLAGRILVSNLHKKTLGSFVATQERIQTSHQVPNGDGLMVPFVNEGWLDWIRANRDALDAMVDYRRDNMFTYFGFKTLEKGYLLKADDVPVERPQDMWMRVASFLNWGDLERTQETYDLLSAGAYIHATPTLFNSGLFRSQLSSCFLLGTEDSLVTSSEHPERFGGIFKTCADMAAISKWGGGLGLHISNIRSKGATIHGTGGKSNGIISMLKMHNEIGRYVNQGGKRNGAIAVYLEPHHPDLLAFLNLRKSAGAETARTRDLFLALWVSDLFMKQVTQEGMWHFICPSACRELSRTYGEEYERLYQQCVTDGKFVTAMPARKVMDEIIAAQIETGMPYMVYKDSVNRKSNQKNLGTIRSSNLCTEIVEFSNHREYAVCNLASIALPMCLIPWCQSEEMRVIVKDGCKYCAWLKAYLASKGVVWREETATIEQLRAETGLAHPTYPQVWAGDQRIGGFTETFNWMADTFDYEKLRRVAYVAARNLNAAIDLNFYPVPETRRSNLRHRPIAVGIQGLANALCRLRIPYGARSGTPAALAFEAKMMEAIYLGAMTASVDLAQERAEMLRGFQGDIPKWYQADFHLEDPAMDRAYHRCKLNRCEIGLPFPGSYSSFVGSPLSEGQFQFDLWNVPREQLAFREEWEALQVRMEQFGCRNSLVTALMPTASTSQILGNNECFEPFTSNIYTRRTLAGEFAVVNVHLIEDLNAIGLWNGEMKQRIIANNGSVAALDAIPEVIRELYRTAWEIAGRSFLEHALARSPFVDQSQSMNIFLAGPDSRTLYSVHKFAWERGLKTGMYYLHSRASSSAAKVTVSLDLLGSGRAASSTDACDMCSA